MRKKILITSFEPFGLISRLRRKNQSKVVLNLLAEESSKNLDGSNGVQYVFATLPVGMRSGKKLQEIIDKEKPDGILSMGEDLSVNPWGSGIVEPYANRGIPFTPWHKKIRSDFVANMPGKKSRGLMGYTECNQVYKTGLEWAKKNGNKPVAFIHVPALGNPKRTLEGVKNVLAHMAPCVR